MQAKNAIIILIMLAVSLITMIWLSTYSKSAHYYQDIFKRISISPPLAPLMDRDLGHNSYYIAGVTSSRIYLGNHTSPLRILLLDRNSVENVGATKISGEVTGIVGPTKISVDSPHFYVADLKSSILASGNLASLRANKRFDSTVFFDQAVPINRKATIIRTINNRKKEFVLAKISADSPHFQMYPNLLKKQVDGLFCVDGMLHYDSKTNYVVYVYYYRNQFLCMDTSLNLLYTGNTIDTTSHTPLDIVEIESHRLRTLGERPLLVNSRTCMDGNLLFIESNMRGDQERSVLPQSYSVIDTYDLNDGSYRFSMYLPPFRGHNMRMFAIHGNQIIALHDRYLVTYNLPIGPSG